MSPLVQSVGIDDLPNEDLKYLADKLGIDAVRTLLASCRGMNFYVPARMTQDFNRRYVKAHYNPQEPNVRELSAELGITQRTIYRMLRERGPQTHARA